MHTLKRKVRGEERSLGTKDHIKWCLPARTSARDKLNDSTSSIETGSSSLNSK